MSTAENIIHTETTMTATVLKDDLVRAIKAALLWASTDTARPHLNCVCLDLEHGKVVATDGHTLIALEVPGLKTGQAHKVLLSASHCKAIAARKLEKKPSKDEVVIDPNAPVNFGDVSYKHVEENYPPYTKVIPDYSSPKGVKAIGVNSGYMARIEKTAKVYGYNGNTKMTFGGELDPMLCEPTGVPGVVVIMPVRI